LLPEPQHRKRPMTIKAVLLTLLVVVVSVAGQLTLKRGMTLVGEVDQSILTQPLTWLWRMFTTTPLIILGLSFYAAGAIMWMIVLSRVNLSLAYPLIALTYVLVPLAAWLLLGEPPIPFIRWIGMAIIVLGVVLVAHS